MGGTRPQIPQLTVNAIGGVGQLGAHVADHVDGSVPVKAFLRMSNMFMLVRLAKDAGMVPVSCEYLMKRPKYVRVVRVPSEEGTVPFRFVAPNSRLLMTRRELKAGMDPLTFVVPNVSEVSLYSESSVGGRVPTRAVLA